MKFAKIINRSRAAYAPSKYFRTWNEWERFKFKVELKVEDPIIVLKEKWDHLIYLPLIPYIEGKIPKNAIKWKYAQQFYPTLHKDFVTEL